MDDLRNYLTSNVPVESEMAQDSAEYDYRNLTLVLFSFAPYRA